MVLELVVELPQRTPLNLTRSYSKEEFTMPTTVKTPTFEEVDKHVQKADLSVFKVAKAKGAAAGVPNVCPAYKTVRPILALVAGLFLIPKKWRDIISGFLGVMDMLCP
jgi:hypothetical protein